MLEIAFMNTKKKTRTVLSIGHGMPQYGQMSLITLIVEDLDDNGNQVWVRLIWSTKIRR